MEMLNYHYKVEAKLKLTLAEVELMRACAEVHYDAKTKGLNAPVRTDRGRIECGTLTSWLKRFESHRDGLPDLSESAEIFVTSNELDSVGKALECPPLKQTPEMAKQREELYTAILKLLQAMGDESIRLNNLKPREGDYALAAMVHGGFSKGHVGRTPVRTTSRQRKR